MIEISDELKAKYQSDTSRHISYKIKFYPNIEMNEDECFLTIENQNIISESVRLTEALYANDSFTYGSVASSEFYFQAADITADMRGAYIDVVQYLDGDVENPIQIGKFIVSSAEKEKDKKIKSVTAYDYMSLAKISGVELYYRYMSFGGSEENTWGTLCQQIADYLGVRIDISSLGDMANSYDYLYFNKGAAGNSFSVRKLIEDIGAILGGWFRFNRFGVLTLYRVGAPVALETIDYGVSFETCETNFVPIDNVHYDTAYGTAYERNVDTNPDGKNSIILNGNIFVTAHTNDDALAQMQIVFDYIKDITYTPAIAKVDARPYLEVGDYFSFYDNGVLKTSLIAKRELTGIQAQKDVFSSSFDIEINNDYDSVQSKVTSNTSTSNVTAKTVEEGNYYISHVRYISETQFSITVKSIKDGSEITNVWNKSVDSSGNEVLENTVNGQTITFEGWPEEV